MDRHAIPAALQHQRVRFARGAAQPLDDVREGCLRNILSGDLQQAVAGLDVFHTGSGARDFVATMRRGLQHDADHVERRVAESGGGGMLPRRPNHGAAAGTLRYQIFTR